MKGSLQLAAAEDDRFHEVATQDATWIETLWFPFWMPLQRATCYVHLHFCPNKQIYRGSVSVWKDVNNVLFLHRFEESLPTLTEFGNLTNLNLPIGLSVTEQRSQHTFDIAYKHPDCRFNFSFDAMMLPVMMSPDASPGMFQGHTNQAGRARGDITLNGEHFGIDCYTVRDRSWGPRHASTAHRSGNCHGTGLSTSFYIYVNSEEDDEERITNGHFLYGGQLARVVQGTRRITWEGNYPKRITLEAEDEYGRSFNANGECINLRLTTSPPNLCVVLNQVKWELAGATTRGESHDVWSEDAWLASGKHAI